ncbi:MAG: LacI family DNA-binding transcriptional regulator [Eubacteriales bacterium]|nr:LacI family DNA-binding transcriptional regulator [Eubacteriales bacterium]
MAATIKDIAERAGCGLATVSSYLNGGNVRPANKEKIEAAIRELNYVVNETARQLKTNRTRMIGAIIPELNSTFCASVLSEIEDILRQHGYAMLVCDCRTDSAREKEAAAFMLNRRVDGLFVIPVDSTGKNLKKFVRSGKPLITIDRQIEKLNCDSVSVDNREAIRSAVEYLIQKGHRKIGLIAGPQEVNASYQRLRGYQIACEENRIVLPESYVFYADGTIGGGTEGIMELRRLHPEMTAVVISSYSMTMGAMIGLNEAGVLIPDDLSVVGFDNPQFAKAVHPTLTIVNQPIKEIGAEAAELMLKRLQEFDAGEEEEFDSKQHRWVKTEILEGHSVRKLQKDCEE